MSVEGGEGTVHVGIGGWNFAPWRGGFYPEGLPQREELAYAARKLTSIEINATFYGSQKRTSFAKWRDEVPHGFSFSLKGPRFATNRRVLAEAGPSIERFVSSGIAELADRLGVINWQLAVTKKYEADDFRAFLDLLPREAEGVPLRHAVEMRHESFAAPDALAALRERGIAAVIADSPDYLALDEVTAPFIYARFQNAKESENKGYSESEIRDLSNRVRKWRTGKGDEPPREAFVYFINGFKPRAPHAAMALIEALGA